MQSDRSQCAGEGLERYLLCVVCISSYINNAFKIDTQERNGRAQQSYSDYWVLFFKITEYNCTVYKDRTCTQEMKGYYLVTRNTLSTSKLTVTSPHLYMITH